MKSNRAKPGKNTRQNSPPPGATSALRQWYAGIAPLLNFVLKFCALVALLYLILLIPFFQGMVAGLTVAEARLSGAILNLLGQHNHVDDVILWSGTRSVIKVVPSCSGVDFLCFFCAAITVFPVPVSRRFAGMLIGVPILLALNLVRIMSLFVLGLRYPRVFDFAHEVLWAVILIITTIVLYINWMKWAGPANLRQADATA